MKKVVKSFVGTCALNQLLTGVKAFKWWSLTSQRPHRPRPKTREKQINISNNYSNNKFNMTSYNRSTWNKFNRQIIINNNHNQSPHLIFLNNKSSNSSTIYNSNSRHRGTNQAITSRVRYPWTTVKFLSHALAQTLGVGDADFDNFKFNLQYR
jgi:hypothetical protein